MSESFQLIILKFGFVLYSGKDPFQEKPVAQCNVSIHKGRIYGIFYTTGLSYRKNSKDDKKIFYQR